MPREGRGPSKIIRPELMAVDLPKRWTQLRAHPEQTRLVTSPARFKVVPAGRRSGKTERAKRQLVKSAIRATGESPAFFAAAPTRDQAKRIYWKDLKALVPPKLIDSKPSETELIIPLVTGGIIQVLGMDRPERIEGSPWDGGILDEYANMKEESWPAHVRPALADRNGWCWLIGVPEGRNHYYERYRRARGELNIVNGGEWDAFTWLSRDILSEKEILAAQQDLDPLTFQQEYEASFVNFVGQAYYPFDETIHCANLRQHYNPAAPISFCLDFNVDPGVAVITQEMRLPRKVMPATPVVVDGRELFRGGPTVDDRDGTACIGEVHIPVNSNTPAVCRKLIDDWGEHQGPIYIYGDATGGARGTAQTEGSDWDLVKTHLYKHFGPEQIHFRVPKSNPTERARINAVNTRLMNGQGEIHMMVDGAQCPNLVKDFEGVRLLVGGSGELDKKHDPALTHLTDAVGYQVVKRFPVRPAVSSVEELRL